ncbi:MAG: hypothetical protein WBP43_02695 [Chitinophagales bacterium]|nr:hypothetical protein [Bacteroidota bacterium]
MKTAPQLHRLQTAIILILFLFVNAFPAIAQNVKDEQIEYQYIKLPLTPLSFTPKNYQASIFATFEAENAKLQAAYEADLAVAEAEYQTAMAAYPGQVQDAKLAYEKALAEWNEKSLAEKVVEKQVLNENNKPVEYIPSPPYKRSVPQPKLQTSYDYPVVADTYLQLGGYDKKPQDAVLIQVTIYGYDYTQPRQMTAQKNVTSIVNGQSTTRSVTYYHVEFSYRHPMSVLVLSPDGKELLNITPQELNVYQVYKSDDSEKPLDINTELLVKTKEEALFQNNLIFINNLVNDVYGYAPTNREAKLYFIKSKDDTYKDLLIAFNEASSGLKLLVDDKQTALTKIESAITSWNAALAESDPQNKKARIDKDITIAVCFNLLECYFATGNTEKADGIFTILNGLSLSYGERQIKDAFESAYNDLKKRKLANTN